MSFAFCVLSLFLCPSFSLARSPPLPNVFSSDHALFPCPCPPRTRCASPVLSVFSGSTIVALEALLLRAFAFACALLPLCHLLFWYLESLTPVVPVNSESRVCGRMCRETQYHAHKLPGTAVDVYLSVLAIETVCLSVGGGGGACGLNKHPPNSVPVSTTRGWGCTEAARPPRGQHHPETAGTHASAHTHRTHMTHVTRASHP